MRALGLSEETANQDVLVRLFFTTSGFLGARTIVKKNPQKWKVHPELPGCQA